MHDLSSAFNILVKEIKENRKFPIYNYFGRELTGNTTLKMYRFN